MTNYGRSLIADEMVYTPSSVTVQSYLFGSTCNSIFLFFCTTGLWSLLLLARPKRYLPSSIVGRTFELRLKYDTNSQLTLVVSRVRGSSHLCLRAFRSHHDNFSAPVSLLFLSHAISHPVFNKLIPSCSINIELATRDLWSLEAWLAESHRPTKT